MEPEPRSAETARPRRAGPGTPAEARPLGRGQSAAGSCQPRSALPGLPAVPSARPHHRPRFSSTPLPRPLREGFSLCPALPSPGPRSPGPAPTHCKLAAVARPGDAGGRRARARGRASPRPAAAAAAAEWTTEPAPGVAAPAAPRRRCLPAEPRRHERGRPLMAARAGSQRAGRRGIPPGAAKPHGPAGSAAVPKPQSQSPVPSPPRLRPETPRPRPEPAPTSCLRPQFGISPASSPPYSIPRSLLCVLGLRVPTAVFLVFSLIYIGSRPCASPRGYSRHQDGGGF